MKRAVAWRAVLAATALSSLLTAQAKAQAPSPAPSAAAPPAAAQPFALTQNAVGFTAENLRFAIGPSAYAIPRAEIRGTELTRDALAAILDPASAIPLAERIDRLSAAEIVIPELRAETTAAIVQQNAVYRDVRVAGVAAGRIASASAASGSFEGSTPDGVSRGTFGRTGTEKVDAGAMVRLLAPATTPDGELRSIYGSFSVENLVSEGPKGASTRMARLAGRDFSARPTKAGWLATATAFAGRLDLNTAPPEERSRVVGAMADLFEAFQVGALEATGIEFSDAAGKNTAGRIGRIAYTRGQDGSEFRIEGLDAGGEEGRVRLALFGMGGISLAPVLSAARDLAGKTGELSAADLRRLVPLIRSVRFGGIEIDAKGDPKGTEPPMRFSLGAVELQAEKPVENVPTDLRLSVRNLSIPIEAAAKDDNAKRLLALGYNKIDASMSLNLGWNEPGQELAIRELSVEGAGMGSVLLRGVVANVTRDVFNPDPALSAIAWTGATARSLDILVANGGLFEKLLAQEAARKKRSVDDLRREYGMTAAVGIPVMLGNAPAAKALGQAVARFIAKPGRLTVQARALDPAGLGVADVLGAPDPLSLLDKVDLKATAE